MTVPVAFVDTETLGLDADYQPVWEVGLILPDGVEHVWQVEVTPRQIEVYVWRPRDLDDIATILKPDRRAA